MLLFAIITQNIDQNKQKIMQSKVKQWQQKFVDSIITLRVGKTKVAKEEFYDAKKKTVNVLDVDVDNIFI